MSIVYVVKWSQRSIIMLLDCNFYMDVRRRWKEKMASVNVDVTKGYE